MAGSSNFQQFNPAQSNSETDQQYAADSLRSGGAATNSILPSITFNKFAYQVTTFLVAFGNALAAKGYNVSDASATNLQTVFAQILTQADQLPGLINLPYSPTLTFDGSKAQGWEVTLFGNVTNSTFVNFQVGKVYHFLFAQDNTGGRTVSWPSQLSANAPQPDPGAGNVSTLSFIATIDGTIRPVTPMTVS